MVKFSIMSPIPWINQAYAIILSDEAQKSTVANFGILGANPGSLGNIDVAMYIRNFGNYNVFNSTNVGPFSSRKMLYSVIYAKWRGILKTIATIWLVILKTGLRRGVMETSHLNSVQSV